jgi:hypothetical protein
VRNIEIALFAVVVLGALGTWWFWNWPEEHRVNTFLAAVESGDQAKAYGIWTLDSDWQQHPERHKAYGFDRFQQDWGSGSPNGQIRTFKTVLSRSWGNGVVMGVDINGSKTPVFLWVDRKTKKIASLRWICAGPYGKPKYLDRKETSAVLEPARLRVKRPFTLFGSRRRGTASACRAPVLGPLERRLPG